MGEVLCIKSRLSICICFDNISNLSVLICIYVRVLQEGIYTYIDVGTTK